MGPVGEPMIQPPKHVIQFSCGSFDKELMSQSKFPWLGSNVRETQPISELRIRMGLYGKNGKESGHH